MIVPFNYFCYSSLKLRLHPLEKTYSLRKKTEIVNHTDINFESTSHLFYFQRKGIY